MAEPGPGAAALPGPAEPTPALSREAGLAEVLTGLSRQNSAYRRMITVCDELADASLKGADAAGLTSVLATLTGKRVLLLDRDYRELAQACGGAKAREVPWNPAEPTLARLLGSVARAHRPLRAPGLPGSVFEHGCLAAPVAVGADSLGFLLVLDEESGQPDDVELLTVTYTATLLALAMARERTSTELGLRYQGTLVSALVSGHFLDDDDARQKARSIGLRDAQPYRVGVARAVGLVAAPLTEHAALRLADDLTRSPAAVLAAGRGNDVVMILPEDAPGAAPGPGPAPRNPAPEPVTSLCRADGERAPLTVGLSDRIRDPGRAPRALLQAQQAIDIGARIGRAGQVIPYDELGIYRLLLLVDEMSQVWQFADEVLGSLVDYDATHRLDLIGTLSAYLAQHGSLKQTARALRVHANTVAYRIKRIESLTGLSLDNSDDRLLAHVSVKIIESQRGRPAELRDRGLGEGAG
jgi:hypothetical protein